MFNENQNAPVKTRYIFLQFLILALFFTMGLRLWYFQIYKGNYYAQQARQNILKKETIYPPRGLIFDKNGKILAENKPSYGLAIVQENCKDIGKNLKQISDWTGIPLKQIKSKYESRKNEVKPFTPQLLIYNLSYENLAVIETQISNWPGLRIITKPLRSYPYTPVCSHILGYVSQVNKQDLRDKPELELDDNIGKRGVELSFDPKLRGEKGYKQLRVNAVGRVLHKKIIKKPQPGTDISLTMDLDLQKFAWDALGNKTGTLIVMQPSTGKILAMVSKPGYPNNRFVQGFNQKTWKSINSDSKYSLRNRAIQNSYPPGSVFKLVVAASALARDKVKLNKERYCPGFYKLGRRKFRCWEEKGHGWLRLKEAIKQSCDVYFYKLGEKLGVDLISDFARKYGFNQKTGIALSSENKGLIPNKKWKLKQYGRKWQGGDTLNMSIGQGYTLITPLQLTRFVAALSNGGHLLRPIIRKNENPEVQSELPLSDEDIKYLIQSMIATVEEPHGTAWRLRTPGATIGGKTGTSQVVKLLEEDREKELSEIPYKQRSHAWMTSFGYKGDRSYVVTAFLEHGGQGGSDAGPVVREIYSYLFNSGVN